VIIKKNMADVTAARMDEIFKRARYVHEPGSKYVIIDVCIAGEPTAPAYVPIKLDFCHGKPNGAV